MPSASHVTQNTHQLLLGTELLLHRRLRVTDRLTSSVHGCFFQGHAPKICCGEHWNFTAMKCPDMFFWIIQAVRKASSVLGNDKQKIIADFAPDKKVRDDS